MSALPILVFDSGVGGLSILDAIRRQCPNENYIYACDNAFFPYGTKAEAELVARVQAVLNRLIAEFSPKILVVACNTASTVALPHLRHHYAIPVVGVVPAIKPAAALSKSKVIGLLATPGTVRRTYTDQLIAEFAADCQVIRVGSSELVEIVENHLRGLPVNNAQLQHLLEPFFSGPVIVDTIVLGCTHFPLLQQELAKAAARDVNWVDSGQAIARRVAHLLGENLRNESKTNPCKAVFTAAHHNLNALRNTLSDRAITGYQIVSI